MKQSTPEQKNRVYGYRRAGMKAKEVAEIEGITVRRVWSIMYNFNYDNPGHSRPRSGRPLALSDRDLRVILRTVTKDPFISLKDLKQDCSLSVSTKTLSRYLVKRGIQHVRAATRPLLNSDAAKRRLIWAKSYIGEPASFWQRVVFSDESSIDRGTNEKQKWAWQSQGKSSTLCQYYLPQLIKEILGTSRLDRNLVQGRSRPHLQSQMFWGAISYNSRSNIVPCFADLQEESRGFTGQDYMEVLEEYLPTILDFGSIFMQDNAPIHSARKVREWLKESGIETLSWPPYSPDLNPIEHIWALLKGTLAKKHPNLRKYARNKQGLEALIKAVDDVWEGIDQGCIQALFDSIPQRLQAVIDAKGWYTKY